MDTQEQGRNTRSIIRSKKGYRKFITEGRKQRRIQGKYKRKQEETQGNVKRRKDLRRYSRMERKVKKNIHIRKK